MSDTMLDFEMEARHLDALYFPFGADATRCRDCHRSIAGRNTRCYQGAGIEGHWVVCDGCNPLGPVPR